MHAQLITLYIILHRNAHTPRQHSMATPGMDLVGGGVLAHVQCRLAPPKWTRLVKNQRVTCAKIFDFWSLLHYCSQNLSTMSANGFSLWGTWSPRPHRGPGHHQGFIPAPQWKLVPSTWATVKLPGVATQHSYINSTTHLSYRRRPHIQSIHISYVSKYHF